jgi:hypothetical protein
MKMLDFKSYLLYNEVRNKVLATVGESCATRGPQSLLFKIGWKLQSQFNEDFIFEVQVKV